MQSAQEKTVNNTSKKLGVGLWASWSLATISIAMALIAMFLLSDWAETAPLHHAIQHLLLFLGGAGFGSSFLHLAKRGVKHEG